MAVPERKERDNNMKKKRIMALLCVSVIALCACGKDEAMGASSKDTSAAFNEAAADSTANAVKGEGKEEAEPVPEPTEEPTPETEEEKGPWEINEDGHVIADGIDLYHFPMEELYKTVESIGEIRYNVHRDGAFCFSFYSEDQHLDYRVALSDKGDGFVDMNVNVEGALEAASQNGGDARAVLGAHEELFTKIVPSVLDADQQVILQTSYEEFLNSEDLDSMPNLMFPFNDQEWWGLILGGGFTLHKNYGD